MFNTETIPDVKERILCAARHLFIKNGYNKTSIRDIATASDTNVAMINYYYRSKYELFEIIFDEALDVLLERVFRVISSDQSFEDLISQWIDSYYETLMEYPQIPIFIINEINLSSERLADRIRNRNPFDIYKKMSYRIEKEIASGNIRAISPIDLILHVLSLCIFPFVFGQMATMVAGKSKNDYDELLIMHKTHVKSFVLHAIKP